MNRAAIDRGAENAVRWVDAWPLGTSTRIKWDTRLDPLFVNNTVIVMKSTVSISEGQNSFPALIKAAEKGSVVTVTRHDAPVAYVMGHERMAAIAETLEIMGNPAAMQAIDEHKAGSTKFGKWDDIPE